MRKQFLAFLLAATTATFTNSDTMAQICDQNCLTNSISVNTGYDHSISTEYAVGTRDEYWKVISLPANAPTTEQPPYCAYVVWDTVNHYWDEYPMPDSITTQWISALPTSVNAVNNATGVPYGYERRFYICGTSNVSVDINLEVMNDDYFTDVLVDNVSLFPSWLSGPTYSSRTIVPTITLSLAPGAHTLVIQNRNTGGGIMGINVRGTISTTLGGADLVNNTCYGKNICNVSPCQIEGDLSVVQTGYTPGEGCHYTATVNASSNGTILGYEWTIPGMPPFIITSGLSSNTQMFTLPTGTGGTISVRILVVNMNINPGESPCCDMTYTTEVFCDGQGQGEGKAQPSGIDNMKYGKIEVFPNPANDNLNIKLQSGNVELVQVFDLQGRKVRSVTPDQAAKNAEVSLKNLQPGNYLVKINNEITVTILKQ